MLPPPTWTRVEQSTYLLYLSGTAEGLDLWEENNNNINNNNNNNLPTPQSMMCHVLSYCCSPSVPIQRISPPISKAHHLHIILRPCSYWVVGLDVSVRPQLLEAFQQLRILPCIVLNPSPKLQPGVPGYPFCLRHIMTFFCNTAALEQLNSTKQTMYV